ncbi:Efflux transporter, RND family, MFP subunit [Lysobacter dokdonensis DS-58]|uniref:Efflux transporter, RND family, MFP subunit n=1 Tax=Lysobacter dokdonensis DS-58 TaxID=1300345 RepID=A0A0A2X189_9GAMM|nr:efflux RND transporter periplasmic adaptor subunit [Lysobacter dokdonensis]KGQ18989.1 Efflux transporter, RND family, MFP subunit [Lysobacter dokdonensis DS-58]
MSANASIHGRTLRAGALLIACALALTACKKGDGDAQAKGKEGEKGPEAIPVEVMAATKRPIAASYTGTAPLEARGESQVVAKTSGVALQVLVQEGQQVHAGQVLVRLDSSRAALQAAQTAALMGKLEANYKRSVTLAEQKLMSANDIDTIRYDLENARAANRLANLELSYANVVAPISGVIAERKIKDGNFVQINTPIFRIVDTSRLEATLNVPEREVATLQQGLKVDLAVDALPGKKFAGTIDRIAPVVDAGSGTFRVICSFEGGGALQPGMFGRIRIDYDQRTDALVVPRMALLEDEGDPAVFAVKAGKAVRVPVKLGYLDGQWAEVREGLKPGDQVVTAGKVALREGSAVQIVGDQAKPAAPAAGKGGVAAATAAR